MFDQTGSHLVNLLRIIRRLVVPNLVRISSILAVWSSFDLNTLFRVRISTFVKNLHIEGLLNSKHFFRQTRSVFIYLFYTITIDIERQICSPINSKVHIIPLFKSLNAYKSVIYSNKHIYRFLRYFFVSFRYI